MFSLHRGFLPNAMHPHRETNLIKLTHYDKTKKRALDLQIARSKENLKLIYGGPSQGQACVNDVQTKGRADKQGLT